MTARTTERTVERTATLEPMYASIGDAVPGAGWTFEPKYDGVRVLAHATPRSTRLVTRNGRDKAAQFPEIAGALVALAKRARRSLVLDGEIIALDGDEPARFQALQGRMHLKGTRDIQREVGETPSALVLFDILADGDESLTGEPWTVRRARLDRRVGPHTSATLRITESSRGDGKAMLRRARADGWEGIIAKQVDSLYQPGTRSHDWLKLKVEFRQELVVGGFTEPRNTREHIGALLLGYFEKDSLVYAGHTGGGFTRAGLARMYARLRPLIRKTSPFTTEPRTNEKATWVSPRVVVEVKFSEWTAGGRLRQPIYLGVRDDKNPRDVRRERVSVQRTARSAARA